MAEVTSKCTDRGFARPRSAIRRSLRHIMIVSSSNFLFLQSFIIFQPPGQSYPAYQQRQLFWGAHRKNNKKVRDDEGSSQRRGEDMDMG